MISSKLIIYNHNGVALEGTLVRDLERTGPLPGVLLIHEFTGPGKYMLPHAERLARAGYAVLICDMYGVGVRPSDSTEASATSRIYRDNRPLMRARARAGLDALRDLPQTDDHHHFVIGFSFGGCAALELLRSGAPVAGAVSFYGYLDTTHPCKPGTAQGRALVLHGAHDKVVPMSDLPYFEDEMRKAGVQYETVVYNDAGHGFANASHKKDPATGSWYCETTAEHAWERTLKFLGNL